MSLTQALNSALSGLQVTQTGLSIVASNVANAETPGYVRKTVTQVATSAGDGGLGVRVTAINRALDTLVQRQLQTETSGGAYADLRAQFYSRLQGVYGAPGSDSALETVYNNFTSAVQALSTSPDASAARTGVLTAAQTLVQQFNGMSSDIQGMRSDAELGLADAVQQANVAMRQIANINNQLGTAGTTDATSAALLDQRDNYISQLSQLMDVRVVATDQNRVSVFTNSGIQLVGAQAAQLNFDPKGALTAESQWSADPTKRSVGTISLAAPNGGAIDLIANKAIRSGQIAAYLEMRDQILPQAQAQLDELAASMSSALSDHTAGGSAVTSPPQAGFDLDIGSLSAGNRVQFSYTDNATGTQRTVTIVRVDDPKALPLPASATPNPNDRVIGLNFSGGAASVESQLNTALAGIGLQFSNPAGTTLRVLDDGAPNKIDVVSASATTTATTLTSGNAELPLFLDGSSPYTGAITASSLQSAGLAGRISVNGALLADPSRLVVYQTLPMTAAGDATRPNLIYSRLTSASLDFSPRSGIGTTTAPFSGTLASYLRQIISQQGDAATAADSLKQGQDIVVNSLQQRLNESSSVNVDTEMANLLNLQTAYSANARVMTTVRDMLNALLQM
jgi:flagellar hook-associated protein 1 FlgK